MKGEGAGRTEGHPRVRKRCNEDSTQITQEPDVQSQSIKFCEFPQEATPDDGPSGCLPPTYELNPFPEN